MAEPTAADRLAYLRVKKLGDCTRCGLASRRLNIVFGEGNPEAKLMLVGEAPGASEDVRGRPFVGDAGHLLDRMLRDAGLDRDKVYIANVVKCRPPGNRDPLPAEIGACVPFLHAQIAVVRPRYLVALGRFAGNVLAGTQDVPMRALEGRVWQYRNTKSGLVLPVIAFQHPAALLRSLRDPALHDALRQTHHANVERLISAWNQAILED